MAQGGETDNARPLSTATFSVRHFPTGLTCCARSKPKAVARGMAKRFLMLWTAPTAGIATCQIEARFLSGVGLLGAGRRSPGHLADKTVLFRKADLRAAISALPPFWSASPPAADLPGAPAVGPAFTHGSHLSAAHPPDGAPIAVRSRTSWPWPRKDDHGPYPRREFQITVGRGASPHQPDSTGYPLSTHPRVPPLRLLAFL